MNRLARNVQSRRTRRRDLRVLSFTVLALIALAAPLLWLQPTAAHAQTPGGMVTMEWLGWSHFRFTSPAGKVILTNPFVANPDSPIKIEDVTKADLILVADGHGDEVGSTVAIAQATGARTLSPFELGSWFLEQGIPQAQVVRSNPGGRFRLDGITVRVVGSVHGSGLSMPTPTTPYGGPAAGFVVTFENGWTVYFAGSTAATQDQALWAQMYQPNLAILNLNAGMEPKDFAMQVGLLTTDNPGLQAVMPHHHRVVQAAGQTTIAEAQAAVSEAGLTVPMMTPIIGEVYRFSR